MTAACQRKGNSGHTDKLGQARARTEEVVWDKPSAPSGGGGGGGGEGSPHCGPPLTPSALTAGH